MDNYIALMEARNYLKLARAQQGAYALNKQLIIVKIVLIGNLGQGMGFTSLCKSVVIMTSKTLCRLCLLKRILT